MNIVHPVIPVLVKSPVMNEVMQKKLPDGWQLCKLGDVMRLKNGYAFKSKDYSEIGIPLIRISDLKEGVVNIDKSVCIPNELIHKGYFVETGDLLIAMSGATTGKIGVYKGTEPVLQNQRVGNFKIIDESAVDKKYRDYFVSSLRKEIEGAAYGGAQPNISAKDIESFEMPLAPPEQQKRIVAKIEELFSHIDAGIEALKKAQKLLKQYRQSVLKAAVTGELTKEWREANKNKLEPASQLLERILKERRQKWEEQQLKQFQAKGKIPKDDKWKGKYKEPKKPALLVDLENPNGWEMASVDQVAEIWLGKMLDKAKHTSGESLQYLRNINVRWGRIDTNNLLKMFFKESELKRYDLSVGDVLVCEGGEPGRSAVWEGGVTMKYQKALHRVRFHLPLIPQYLVYLLEYFASTGLLQRYFTGSTIKHFTKESFTTLPFPLPSILEMEEMVFRVEEKLYSINKLEDELDIQLLKAEKNKQSILSAAFSGVLS